jgi:parvulin-like peptidyl-prolyl isomerase
VPLASDEISSVARRVLLSNPITEQAFSRAYSASVRALPQGFPSEAELTEYYAKNQPRFVVPEQVNFSTIFLPFLPARAGNKGIEATVQADAASLSARAKAGADFVELARRHSQHRPTAEQGGLVGWVTQEQLAPELAQVAFTLKPGEVSEPIRTPFGFQIIRINDRKPAGQRSFDEARGEIDLLRRHEQQTRKERETSEAIFQPHPISVDAAITLSIVANEVTTVDLRAPNAANSAGPSPTGMPPTLTPPPPGPPMRERSP